MSYTFTKKPFEWTKAGADPTTQEIALGLQGGMALPAAFVNQQWKKTYDAIKEIQDKVEDGTIGGGSDSANLRATNSVSVGEHGTISATTNFAVFGVNNNTADGVFVCGKRSKTVTASSESTSTGDLFVVGSGVSSGTRANAFRVTSSGDVMGTKSYSASGADYSEMFEWLDGNPDAEDRRGLFVTLDGEKIRAATEKDFYILGVVSATPSVIGDAQSDDWQGKYETDVYGARILVDGTYKLSEGFDEEKDNNYTPRAERAEWAAVGLVGKLVVRDDGSCKVNGFCYPKKNGIATESAEGYRVMKRIDKNHIRILVK